MSHVALAECIRLAANIREASFDPTKVENPAFPLWVGGYRKTLREACEEAEASYANHKGWGEVTYMLLRQNWNEALDWANAVLAAGAPSDMLSQSA